MIYDVIVCGAGVQGLWTSYYLLQQNKKILLLEQFPLFNSRGSSHGGSRITRYTYDSKHHASMMPEAFKKWEELEEKTEQELFINTGVISMGPERILDKDRVALTSICIPYEHIKSSEVERRFPGLVSHGYNGIFENTGGILKAQRCLLALSKAIKSLGGDIKDCEKVNEVTVVSDSLVKVRSNNATYSSASLVLTCGPWTNKLLKPLDLQLPLRTLKIQVNYWKAKNPRIYDAKVFPATRIYNEHFSRIYSVPALEYPGLMKVCCHTGIDVDPDARDEKNEEAFEKRRLRFITDMIRLHYPNLHPEPAVTETCIYTNTPDSDFILDRHPAHANIIIGAGFSGHGFKLAPVVGRILGDLVMNKEPAYPLHYFTLSRFKNKAKL